MLNVDVWAYCFETHAEETEALYPIEFQMAANAIIARDFNMVGLIIDQY